MKAPIVLFVYNRPYHTQRTLESLSKCQHASDSKLYIYSDGPKNDEDNAKIKQVKGVIAQTKGFKSISIVERADNRGLSNNIIGGVNEVIERYGKVIVLEDDLLLNASFLSYMNQALDFYQNYSQIFSVSGYSNVDLNLNLVKTHPYDTFFDYRNSSWGWATWKHCWNKVDWKLNDFDEFATNEALQTSFNRGGNDLSKLLIAHHRGNIDSWSIRFTYAHFKHTAYTVKPFHSLVANIGLDGSGTHCGPNDSRQDAPISSRAKNLFAFPEQVKLNERVLMAARHNKNSRLARVRNRLINFIRDK